MHYILYKCIMWLRHHVVGLSTDISVNDEAKSRAGGILNQQAQWNQDNSVWFLSIHFHNTSKFSDNKCGTNLVEFSVYVQIIVFTR